MFKNVRLVASFAAVAAATLVLSACSAPATSPTPAGTGTIDAEASLTVGLVLEPGNLDIRHTAGAALEQLLIDNVYEGLVTRSAQNKVEPRLAEDFDVSADGLLYTFHLRDGVRFQSGAPLNSQTVVDSFEQARTDETVNGNAVFSGVTEITAPDDATVTIALEQSNQNFLFDLTGPGGLVFNQDSLGAMQSGADGTGPFTVDSWDQGARIVLARNADYWGTKAGVAEVVLEYIPDFTAGFNAAADGTLDVLTAVDPNLAPQLEGDFALTFGRTTDKGTLAFNNQKAPLNDVRVRQALRLAVDHEAMVLALGQGTSLYGPIPELDPGYQDLSDLAPYDPNQARALLAEAGFANGLALTLTIPSFYGPTVPQILVSDYAAVGVTLTVNQVEFSTWLNDVYHDHNFELSFVLHVEPRDFENFANPDYYFGYQNPVVADLYAQAMSAPTPEASAQLLAEAARIVSGDHAADWLYNMVVITAVSPQVQEFPVDSINSRLRLEQVTVLR